jgi:hypothetical protein
MAIPVAGDLAIKLVDFTSAQSVEVTSKGDVKTLIDKDGKYVDAAVQDPTFEFSVRGKGDACPVALDDTETGKPTGVTGIMIITSVKEGTSNDDWEDWEYRGQAFPSAT